MVAKEEPSVPLTERAAPLQLIHGTVLPLKAATEADA